MKQNKTKETKEKVVRVNVRTKFKGSVQSKPSMK